MATDVVRIISFHGALVWILCAASKDHRGVKTRTVLEPLVLSRVYAQWLSLVPLKGGR